jgi:hypothetical protein
MKAYQARADAHLTGCLSGPSAHAGPETLLRTEVEMATGPDSVGVSFITQPPLTHASVSESIIAGVEACRAYLSLKLKDRFDQAVREGELPPQSDTDALGRLYSIVIQGLALDAQHGATRQQLLRAVDVAIAAWP